MWPYFKTPQGRDDLMGAIGVVLIIVAFVILAVGLAPGRP
jgi:hypothetical protein